MSIHLYTDEQKLVEIRALLRDCIREEVSPFRIGILKAVAHDIQARRRSSIDLTVKQFEVHLASLRRSKTRDGYDARNLRALAEEFIGRWPVIRSALQALLPPLETQKDDQ